ncbi:hypothetical protein EDB81DRAFT_458244 [Dactylonectria macrodidyma]|uniref:Uncharacterized protein n=1 Tax=Dactylonectria macrodidyma TaxID=307937 RepID=A0A9P9J7F6_9HYPO|nr:hypothetical protein EDB81DRAFT_458244 [Dactylonectria macrodidyma]
MERCGGDDTRVDACTFGRRHESRLFSSQLRDRTRLRRTNSFEFESYLSPSMNTTHPSPPKPNQEHPISHQRKKLQMCPTHAAMVRSETAQRTARSKLKLPLSRSPVYPTLHVSQNPGPAPLLHMPTRHDARYSVHLMASPMERTDGQSELKTILNPRLKAFSVRVPIGQRLNVINPRCACLRELIASTSQSMLSEKCRISTIDDRDQVVHTN